VLDEYGFSWAEIAPQGMGSQNYSYRRL